MGRAQALPALPRSGGDLGDINVRPLRQHVRPVAVVGRPGRDYRSVAARREAAAHVQAPGAIREVDGVAPGSASEGHAPQLPSRIEVVHVRNDVFHARIATAEKHPDPTVAVSLDRRGIAPVSLEICGQRRIQRDSRFQPALAVKHGDRHPAPLVQPGAFVLEPEAVILTPLGAALAPSRPETVV